MKFFIFPQINPYQIRGSLQHIVSKKKRYKHKMGLLLFNFLHSFACWMTCCFFPWWMQHSISDILYSLSIIHLKCGIARHVISMGLGFLWMNKAVTGFLYFQYFVNICARNLSYKNKKFYQWICEISYNDIVCYCRLYLSGKMNYKKYR